GLPTVCASSVGSWAPCLVSGWGCARSMTGDTSRLADALLGEGDSFRISGCRVLRRHGLRCFFSSRRRHTRLVSDWSSDVCSSDLLTGVAFRRGVGGKGGMPADSRPDEHGPRQLRVEVFAGLVFGTLGAGAVPVEQYLG